MQYPIEKINSFHVDGSELQYLPENISNNNLELVVWGYGGETLPQNWVVEKLTFLFNKKIPIIPKTLKHKELFI